MNLDTPYSNAVRAVLVEKTNRMRQPVFCIISSYETLRPVVKMWSESETVRKKMSIRTDVQKMLTYHLSSTTNSIYVKGIRKKTTSGIEKVEKDAVKELTDMSAAVTPIHAQSHHGKCFLRCRRFFRK